MELMLISLFAVASGLVVGVIAALHWLPRRQARAVPASTLAPQQAQPPAPAESKPPTPLADLTTANLRMLRRIDKMILSNLSFSYVAQEIVDLIPDTGSILGGTLRVADEKTGQLDVIAVTKDLADPARKETLKGLVGTSLSPQQVQKAAPRLADAINRRQVETGEELADFEGPTLSKAEAEQAQQELGIKSVAVYPIVVEEHLSGSLTFYFSRPLKAITQHDHEVMQGLADEVGIAIENSRLLLQLADMNQQLSEANAHLKEVDALKDDFIAVASHQLRSPLTAIRGYLSMLNEGDFGPVPKEQRTILAQLGHSSNEVINLINDMLSVSRLNAGKFELARSTVKLDELVREIYTELKPLADKKHLQFDVIVPEGSLELTVDPLRIRQVIINFIDNAIKYTVKGSVQVKVAKEADDVVFTVKDTGIGIPSEELDKMFKKFYRATNARAVEAQGSGLGLYVAREIIRKHHGDIILESEEGSGSTFGFRLPMAAVSSREVKRPTEVGA